MWVPPLLCGRRRAALPGSPPARLPGSSGKGCLRSDSWREALQTQPEVRSAGRETHAVWRSRAACPAPAGVPPGHVGRAQRRRPWRLMPPDVGPSSVSPQSCSECSSSDPPVASLLSLVLNWGLGDWRHPGQVPRPGCQLRPLHLRGPSWGGAGSVGAQGRTLDASPRVSAASRALLTRVSLGDSCVCRTEASAERGAVGRAPCPSGVRPPGWCPARFTPAPLLLVVSAGPGPGVTPAQQACCAHTSRSRASGRTEQARPTGRVCRGHGIRQFLVAFTVSASAEMGRTCIEVLFHPSTWSRCLEWMAGWTLVLWAPSPSKAQRPALHVILSSFQFQFFVQK